MGEVKVNEEGWNLPYSSVIKFSGKIENFTTVGSLNLSSEVSTIKDQIWMISIIRTGTGEEGDRLAVHLEASDSEMLPRGWSAHAKFKFPIISFSGFIFDDWTEEYEHTFTEYSRSWSFKPVIPDPTLYHEDTLTFRAEVWFGEEKEEAEVDKVSCKEQKSADLHELVRALNHSVQMMTEQVRSSSDRLVTYFDLRDAERKKVTDQQVDSVSRDDNLLKQCMERLNTLKNEVSVWDYGCFTKVLIGSRDMRTAFLCVPKEFVAQFLHNVMTHN